MNQDADKQIVDVAQVVARPVGRPRSENPSNATQRKRASRERLKAAGGAFLTVRLPIEVIDGLRRFRQFKDLTNDEIIERLLRQQLLRKR